MGNEGGREGERGRGRERGPGARGRGRAPPAAAPAAPPPAAPPRARIPAPGSAPSAPPHHPHPPPTPTRPPTHPHPPHSHSRNQPAPCAGPRQPSRPVPARQGDRQPPTHTTAARTRQHGTGGRPAGAPAHARAIRSAHARPIALVCGAGPAGAGRDLGHVDDVAEVVVGVSEHAAPHGAGEGSHRVGPDAQRLLHALLRPPAVWPVVAAMGRGRAPALVVVRLPGLPRARQNGRPCPVHFGSVRAKKMVKRVPVRRLRR